MAEGLADHELARYQRDGVLFPLPVLSAAEVASFREAFDRLVEGLGGAPRSTQLSQCHLSFRWVHELATRDAILDRVETVIGPDLLIHSSTFFFKRPHDPAFVSWHQDSFYWGLSEPRLTSAWVALTGSDPDNGCMRVVPGSHRHDHLPHDTTAISEDNLLGSGIEIAVEVEDEEAVDVVLEPGQMSLHHASIVHGSNPNRSFRPRIGLAVRYLAADVSQSFEHHAVTLARGTGGEAFEVVPAPPAGREPEAELAAHAAFARRLKEARERQGRAG